MRENGSPVSTGKFKDFIAPEADRFRLLTSILTEYRVPFKPIALAGNRHIILSPRTLGQNWAQNPPRIVLAAHYDRVPGSPGANDNSAAVFLLIETALELQKTGLSNWLIIFTDKEELAHGEGIQDQGSYTLALTLKNLGCGDSRYYIFDACGVGDCLIISTSADRLMRDSLLPGVEIARRKVQALRNGALEAVRDLSMAKALLAPTPFSDDAGFLRAGVAAQTIAMLPSPEAARLASLLRTRPEFADALIAQGDPALRRLFPETWRSLNGPGDSPLLLTPEHHRLVINFACELCRNA